MKKLVVIGGGHGLATIAKGLKKYQDVDMKFIISVADNGGSTGRLRQLYDLPAMGDLRNVMVALSKDEDILAKLMDYRFEGIENHSLGNLIITALSQISGNFNNSIKDLSKVLRIRGEVIPSTHEKIDIYARMDDGTIVKGESSIPSFIHHINEIFYDHDVKASEEAANAIKEADLIVYGIGSLYTSIIPNTAIKGIHEALIESKAKKVYFANCMTQSNETFDYDIKDHYDALIKHGGVVDMVIKHSDKIPPKILNKYKETNSIEVKYQREIDIPVICEELLVFDDDLIRHDSTKIAKKIMEMLEE